MFTTVAYYELVAIAGVYNALSAVADPHVTVVGDDIRVPSLPQIVAAAIGSAGTAPVRSRLVAPSLRRRTLYQITPLNIAAAGVVEPGSPQAVLDLRAAPLKLVPTENVNIETLVTALVTDLQWGVLWFADGPIAPVRGEIFTVRATSSVAAVAGTWVNEPLVFDEDLQAGTYQVVGLRSQSATMIASRLVFVGGSGWRPGALGVDVQADLQHPMFRGGELGVYGEFNEVSPPTIDVLCGAADATQEHFLDLIQTSAVTP